VIEDRAGRLCLDELVEDIDRGIAARPTRRLVEPERRVEEHVAGVHDGEHRGDGALTAQPGMGSNAVRGAPHGSQTEMRSVVQAPPLLATGGLDGQHLLGEVGRRIAVAAPGEWHLDELLEQRHHDCAGQAGENASSHRGRHRRVRGHR
jgi:hypothetical protein